MRCLHREVPIYESLEAMVVLRGVSSPSWVSKEKLVEAMAFLRGVSFLFLVSEEKLVEAMAFLRSVSSPFLVSEEKCVEVTYSCIPALTELGYSCSGGRPIDLSCFLPLYPQGCLLLVGRSSSEFSE